MNILVTGGTGTLGRHIVRTALGAGHGVRVQSRRPRSENARAADSLAVEWRQADLASGDGVPEAVAGVDAVVHAAHDPRKPQLVDVGGTRRLVEAARAAGVDHIIYVSIVGVDRIPFGYYRAKVEAEQIVAESGVPYSVLRATQFHSFVDQIISVAGRIPLLLPLPTDFRVQSVAAEEVAERLIRALTDGPGGRLPDLGGPEVTTLGEAAARWKVARGVRKPVVRLPLFGGFAAGFRAGYNTVTEEGDRAAVRWEDWLAQEPTQAWQI